MILVYRRASVRRVAVTTSYADLLVYALLFFVIALGMSDTLSHNRSAPATGTTIASPSRSGSAVCSRSKTTPS